jgi:O-antigen/teichoic acid export membrane protein
MPSIPSVMRIWQKSLYRSIGSVVLGYLLFAIPVFLFFQLSGQPPHAAAPPSIMAASILVGVLAAFAGGFAAAHLAGRKPLAHGLAVAAVLAAGAIASLASTMGHGAIWSQVAALVLMAPSAAFGGWARQSTRTSQ